MKDFQNLKLITFICILFFVCCGKEDQKIEGEANITGNVFYSGTTMPVSGVIILVDGQSATSGSDGKYSISGIKEGSHTLTATKSGFDEYSVSLQINNGTNNFDIEFTSAEFTHNLSGKVFSDNPFTGSIPLSFCKVVVLNPDGSESKLMSQSSSSGFYQIPTVPQGNRTIRFSANNYETIEIEIFLANSDYDLDMEMQCIDCPKFIGQFYGGGLLFHVFEPGEPGYMHGEIHGLIALPWDLSSGPSGAQWGCIGTFIGATNSALGTGLSNTINITNKCKESGIAATICWLAKDNNYVDWYLPSRDELELMKNNLYLLGKGNFSLDGVYWSSTETTEYNAYGLSFRYNTWVQHSKNNSSFSGAGNVRPIRTF